MRLFHGLGGCEGKIAKLEGKKAKLMDEAKGIAADVARMVAKERKVHAKIDKVQMEIENARRAQAFRGFQAAKESAEGVDWYDEVAEAVDKVGWRMAEAGMDDCAGAWHHIAAFVGGLKQRVYDPNEDPIMEELRSVSSASTVLVGVGEEEGLAVVARGGAGAAGGGLRVQDWAEQQLDELLSEEEARARAIAAQDQGGKGRDVDMGPAKEAVAHEAPGLPVQLVAAVQKPIPQSSNGSGEDERPPKRRALSAVPMGRLAKARSSMLAIMDAPRVSDRLQRHTGATTRGRSRSR